MKIIFLDMDGVMCPWMKHNQISENCIARLNALCKFAEVVITSSWRNWYPILSIEQKLRDAGWTGKLHEDSCTTVLFPEKPNGYRSKEIRDWLERHTQVTHYVIFDDEPEIFESGQSNLVLTNSNAWNSTLLSESMLDKAMSLLEETC